MSHTVRLSIVVLLSIFVGCNDQSPPSAASIPAAGSNPAWTPGPSARAPVPAMSDARLPTGRSPSTPPVSFSPLAATPKLSSTATLPSRAGGEEVDYRHHLKLKSAMRMALSEGPPQQINANTEVHYTWRWQGPQADLLINQMTTEVLQNGLPMTKFWGNRTAFVTEQGGEVFSETYESGNPDVQQRLGQCFDNPLYRIVVDANGQEIRREKLVEGTAAQLLTDNGIDANARMFHPPFYGDRDRWESTREVAMGNNSVARGPLTYEVTKRSPAIVEVQVTGRLAGAQRPQPGLTADVFYDVRGTQAYDTRLREWVGGTWHLDVTMEMQYEDQKISGTGTIEVSMSLLATRFVSR